MFHSGGRPGRVYTLGSQTQDDMEAWMKLLACSSYDYMKLMVVELQQQLAELEENERQAAAQRGNCSIYSSTSDTNYYGGPK